jgi:hypothetical protein
MFSSCGSTLIQRASGRSGLPISVGMLRRSATLAYNPILLHEAIPR